MTTAEQLTQLQEHLLTIKGREVECYSRIVGYYRATQLWNKGKAEEFKVRKEFQVA